MMTDEEVARVRAEVDRIAEPLAFLAMVWLLTNPEAGKNWPLGGAGWNRSIRAV